MDESSKKAFDFAADLTKQLITVASAIVTLTVTFSKDTPAPARGWAYLAWLFFLISILLGFGTLMCMTGELQPKANNGVGTNNPSIWRGNITFFSSAQIGTFLIAISLTAWFGKIAMQSSRAESTPPQICNCQLTLRQPIPQTGGTAPSSGSHKQSQKKGSLH
jgi:hypothetical protein